MSNENCILCQIVEKNIPSQVIYEDEYCIAILDVNGAQLGHTFIVPKTHYPILEQVPDDEFGHLFTVANKVSSMLFEKLKTLQGTNIYVANGIPAGQRVAHFMIHVIPRTENDGINLQWQPKQLPPEEIDASAAKLQDQLKSSGAPTVSSSPSAPSSGSASPQDSYDADDEDDYFMHHIDRIPRG